MAYNLIWGKKGVYIKYADNLKFPDLLEVQGKLIGDSRYDSIQYEIEDFTDVQAHELSEQEVRLISGMDRAASCYHREKQHILVSDKKEFIPLIELYLKALEGTSWDTHLFTTLDEALAHLKKMGILVEH